MKDTKDIQAGECEKRHECWTCRYYRAHYVKGHCCFNRLKHGECTVKKEIRDHHDSCDSWKSCHGQRASLRTLPLVALQETLRRLNELGQIMAEELGNDSIYPSDELCDES